MRDYPFFSWRIFLPGGLGSKHTDSLSLGRKSFRSFGFYSGGISSVGALQLDCPPVIILPLLLFYL